MLTHYDLEKLALDRQASLLAEAAAERRLPAPEARGPRRALAAALASLARRIDPAVWDRPIRNLPLPTGDAS